MSCTHLADHELESLITIIIIIFIIIIIIIITIIIIIIIIIIVIIIGIIIVVVIILLIVISVTICCQLAGSCPGKQASAVCECCGAIVQRLISASLNLIHLQA